MLRPAVEELRRKAFDDLDDAVHEPVGGSRGDHGAARRHDGSGRAGELDSGAPLELFKRDLRRELLKAVCWLVASTLPVVS